MWWKFLHVAKVWKTPWLPRKGKKLSILIDIQVWKHSYSWNKVFRGNFSENISRRKRNIFERLGSSRFLQRFKFPKQAGENRGNFAVLSKSNKPKSLLCIFISIFHSLFWNSHRFFIITTFKFTFKLSISSKKYIFF